MNGFTLMGCYCLTKFMQNHYEIKDKRAGSISERKFDLQKEYSEMMKNLVILLENYCTSNLQDIDNYTLSRIPRSEEENPVEQQEPLDILVNYILIYAFSVQSQIWDAIEDLDEDEELQLYFLIPDCGRKRISTPDRERYKILNFVPIFPNYYFVLSAINL